MSPDTFEKDGRTITFQRAALTPEGAPRARRRSRRYPWRRRRRLRLVHGNGRCRSRRARRRPAAGREPTTRARRDERPGGLVAKLRAWRLVEARRRGVPAFRIFPDRTLLALAEARPASEDALMAVAGVGPRLVRLYGPALLKLLS